MSRDPLFWIGLLLGGVALVGLCACWRLGTVRQPTKPHMPDQLRSAAEHKRRVEQNRQIAMGRVREIEQRRAS